MSRSSLTGVLADPSSLAPPPNSANPTEHRQQSAYQAGTSFPQTGPVAPVKWRSNFQLRSRISSSRVEDEAASNGLKTCYQGLAKMLFSRLDVHNNGCVNLQDLRSMLQAVKSKDALCLAAANTVLSRITYMSAVAISLAEFLAILACSQQLNEGCALTALLDALLQKPFIPAPTRSSASAAFHPPSLQNAPQLSASVVFASSLFSSSECSSSDCSSQRSSFETAGPSSCSRLHRTSSHLSNPQSMYSSASSSASSSKRSSLDDDDSSKSNAFDTLTAAKVRLHGLSHTQSVSQEEESIQQSPKPKLRTRSKPPPPEAEPMITTPSMPSEQFPESSSSDESMGSMSSYHLPLTSSCLSIRTAGPVASWPLPALSMQVEQPSVSPPPSCRPMDASADFLADKLRHEDALCQASMEALVFASLPSPRADGTFLDCNTILELPLVQTLLMEHRLTLFP